MSPSDTLLQLIELMKQLDKRIDSHSSRHDQARLELLGDLAELRQKVHSIEIDGAKFKGAIMVLATIGSTLGGIITAVVVSYLRSK